MDKSSLLPTIKIHPLVAKKVLCMAHTFLLISLVILDLSNGTMSYGFDAFWLLALVPLVEGVLIANILMQGWYILLALIAPWLIVYARGFFSSDHVKTWLMVLAVEIVCFGMLYLLKSSRPAFTFDLFAQSGKSDDEEDTQA